MAYKMKKSKMSRKKSRKIKGRSKKIKASRGLTGRRGARY